MILDRFSLEGRVAVVTGGGTGLGKAMCHAVARAGADVVVASRSSSSINETAEEVRILGRRALAVPTDITDSEQVNNLMKRTIGELGCIDILINNAGIARGIEPSPRDAAPKAPPQIWEMNDDMWRQGLDVNLTGAFYCCRAVAKHMIDRGKGKVINIASLAGLRPARNLFTYCSAKAGLIMLTKVLAVTWARKKIQVNSIAPGVFANPESAADIIRHQAAQIPMGRCGNPEEIGSLAVFLASEASNYITGECFILDGGRFMRYAPNGYGPLIELNEEARFGA
jgi:NAD(P)-dependent dehydrogenase (short-subunit alcohol dehydrogenase family)